MPKRFYTLWISIPGRNIFLGRGIIKTELTQFGISLVYSWDYPPSHTGWSIRQIAGIGISKNRTTGKVRVSLHKGE